MAQLAIDSAAWTGRWRHRPVGEKAFLAIGLLGVAMVSQRLVVDALVVLISFGAVVVGSRVPVATVLRAWSLPASFVVIGLLGILVSVGPPSVDAVSTWGVFSVSETSLDTAVRTGARSMAAMAAVLVLALTTPMSDLLAALRRVGVPAFLVEIASLVYRMLFLLLDTQSQLRESQSARLGYANRRAAVRSLGSLFAAVLIRAWTRAEDLEAGLAGRGYDGSLVVTRPERVVSWRFITATAAVVALLLTVSFAPSLTPSWS